MLNLTANCVKLSARHVWLVQACIQCRKQEKFVRSMSYNHGMAERLVMTRARNSGERARYTIALTLLSQDRSAVSVSVHTRYKVAAQQFAIEAWLSSD